MQTLQVYIGETRLDLFSDETINVTQSIQNIRDISKIFTDFSRSFTVPASKTNNKIFKHYNNKNIVDGFDARKKVDALLEINNKPFKKGKVKLDGVNVKDGLTSSYKITFFGNTVNLKDLIGEDKLYSLDWLDNFSLDYDAATVKEALEGGKDFSFDGNIYEKAIVTPLVTNTTRLFYDTSSTYTPYPNALGGNLEDLSAYSDLTHSGVYFEELKYSIRVHLIIKAIQEKYGILFSEDFFNEENPEYYNLYLWLHRDKGRAFEGSEVVSLIKPFEVGTYGRFAITEDSVLVFSTYGANILYSLNIQTNTPATFKVVIKKDGVVFTSQTVENGSNVTLNGQLFSSSTGYKVYIETSQIFTVTATWTINDLSGAGTTVISSATNVALNVVRQYDISSHTPNIKVIDFLTGIFKMFNLTAYQENGVVIVKTLDNYYNDSSVVWPVDEYIDSKDEIVDNALPFNEVKFKYKGANTFLAKKHTNQFSQQWGELSYTSDDYYNASPNSYTVELPFEHLKYERLLNAANGETTSVQYGWFVDDNAATFVGDSLLFYPILNTGTNIRFLNNENYVNANSKTTVSQYYIPSNSVSLDSTISKSNINFFLQTNEYTFTGGFDKTLFNKYYTNYISNVFNVKNRVTILQAYLPLRFLLNYQLNDKIRFRGNYYIINSINADLLNGKATLELLNEYDFTETSGIVICPTADTTFVAADSTEYKADVSCGEPPAPTCETTMFSASASTTSAGAACGLAFTVSLWHSGTGIYPAIGDRIYSDVDCLSFPDDGFIKIVDENTTIEVLQTAPNIYSTVISKTACTSNYLPSVVTNSVTDTTATSATLNGTIVDEGVPPYTSRGFYWMSGPGTPSAANNVETVSGTGTGAFSVGLTGLTADQVYSVRTWATNTEGTALGNVIQFTASSGLFLPTVQTVSSSSVGESSANLNGSILNTGNPNYTSKGFYYMQGTGTPTAANSTALVSGTAAGAYSKSITGLPTSTLFSFRAFAINTQGTAYGATQTFTTLAPVCDGGILSFQQGTMSGVNMTLSTGQTTYTTCQTPYSISLNLFNNETGEWNSTSEVTAITVFEGATDVTGNFTITKTLVSGVIAIQFDGTTPTAVNDGNKTYTVNVTASPTATFQTDITVTQSVLHSSLVVTDTTGTVVGPNFHSVVGGTGKNFFFLYTYTADSGYEFTGIGNIQNLVASGVSAVIESYTATTIVVRISGTIGVTNQTATASWNGSSIADPATSVSVTYRFGTSGPFFAIPAAGIDVGTGGQIIQLEIVPNGSYYVALANTNVVYSVTPTEVYSGDTTIHNVYANTFTGGEGNLSTLLRIYPRASSTSIGTVRFNYFDSI